MDRNIDLKFAHPMFPLKVGKLAKLEFSDFSTKQPELNAVLRNYKCTIVLQLLDYQ